jgi:hypothetical protein
MRPRQLGDAQHLGIVDAVAGQHDILAHAARQQHRLLQRGADQAAHR